MRLFGIIIALVAAIIILSMTFAGGKEVPLPTIDYGPRALTGVLLKAEVSLTRRGAHLLFIDGKPAMYAESKSVNLGPLEGQTVFVEGDLQPNTKRSDLPVLLVRSAKPAFTVFAVKSWELKPLNIRLETPSHWQNQSTKESASFRVGTSENAILLIQTVSGSSLPPGRPFLVRSKQATRVESGTAHDIYILDKGKVLHLHFDAAFQEGITRLEDAALLKDQFEHVLKSIVFLSSGTKSSVEQGTGSFVSAGICGGAARLLCPQGSFCSITDNITGEGTCRKR